MGTEKIVLTSRVILSKRRFRGGIQDAVAFEGSQPAGLVAVLVGGSVIVFVHGQQGMLSPIDRTVDCSSSA